VINQIKYYFITNNDKKKFILIRLAPLILLYIKMKQENKDMSLNFGMIQILLHIGPLNIYGHIQLALYPYSLGINIFSSILPKLLSKLKVKGCGSGNCGCGGGAGYCGNCGGGVNCGKD
jgi:hypothetical protein